MLDKNSAIVRVHPDYKVRKESAMAISNVKAAINALCEEARREFEGLSDEDWKDTTVIVEILPGVELGKISLGFKQKEKGK